MHKVYIRWPDSDTPEICIVDGHSFTSRKPTPKEARELANGLLEYLESVYADGKRPKTL